MWKRCLPGYLQHCGTVPEKPADKTFSELVKLPATIIVLPHLLQFSASNLNLKCGGMGHLKRDCPKWVLLSAEHPLLEYYKHVPDTGWVLTAYSRMSEVQVCMVKGRLGICIQFWREELCANHWVIDTITKGYVLPPMLEPQPYSCPN
mgnify:CR=1 FL=1